VSLSGGDDDAVAASVALAQNEVGEFDRAWNLLSKALNAHGEDEDVARSAKFLIS
jgi:hypothetical protein